MNVQHNKMDSRIKLKPLNSQPITLCFLSDRSRPLQKRWVMLWLISLFDLIYWINYYWWRKQTLSRPPQPFLTWTIFKLLYIIYCQQLLHEMRVLKYLPSLYILFVSINYFVWTKILIIIMNIYSNTAC
jgi:hypothetical protein